MRNTLDVEEAVLGSDEQGCPYCGDMVGGKPFVSPPIPNMRAWTCSTCGAFVSVIIAGGDTFHGHVVGESADEVSTVVREMLAGATPGSAVRVSDSVIGVLNTGRIGEVSDTRVHSKSESESLHHALDALADAAERSSDLSESDRGAVLAQLGELKADAGREPDRRLPSAIVRAVLGALAASMGAAADVAQVWSTWGPQVRAFFHP